MFSNYLDVIGFLNDFDKEISDVIKMEFSRQKECIDLIASENYASPAVMAAMGSVLTNKYAEGYPSKRYYGGCRFVDMAENIAIERAKELFGAKFANVQPHSGSNANFSAYFALLKPNDTVLGMSLSEGGHLTHGSPVNFSGNFYNFIPYGLNKETERLDYDMLEVLCQKHKPKMIVAGASAYPRIIDFERISQIAKKYNALLLVDMAHIAGLVAVGLHPSPLPYADVVTSTTHKTLRGPRGGLILTNNEEIAKKIDKANFPGTQGGPLPQVIAAKAVAFKEALSPDFRAYGENILKNSKALVESLKKRGMKIVTDGTDNHIVLVDLTSLEITGKQLEANLEQIGIISNKNTVPNEKRSPFITSGIRLGTAAATTRGLNVTDFEEIGNCIHLCAVDFENNIDYCRDVVKKLATKYPIYS